LRLCHAEGRSASDQNATGRAQGGQPAATPRAVARSGGDAGRSDHPVPLVVALEGCLVSTDLLIECLFLLAKDKPLEVLRLPWWLARGRAQFKQNLARKVSPDVHTLPYRRDLLAYLEAEKRAGRRLILATAMDEAVAHLVAREIGLFDAVLASDGTTDLAGEQMRKRLVAEFGMGGFDYAGHSRGDRAIWRAARRVILVWPSRQLRNAAAKASEIERVFGEDRPGPEVYRHALRVDHWVKNVLLFVPLLVAHRLYDGGLLAHALVAAIAFSLCASSVYLINDLMDLAHDRAHPHKKHRMLASGRLPVGRAVRLIPLLLCAAVALGATQSLGFLSVMGAYFLLMVAYSLRLRDFLVLDVLTLATGYALRVVAGAAATNLAAPAWLVLSCVLFFAGLALLKRYAELVTMRAFQGERARARAYRAVHDRWVAFIGCSSGYLAVLVLALHIGSEGQLGVRSTPVWIVFLLLLYWITHIWRMAHLGRISNDPVAFALRDHVSLIVAVLMAIAVLIAT
jgi:4-hydroxybenzoate polyprenyltransferase